MQDNEFFLNGKAQGMLEKQNYRPIDIGFPIGRGFIGRVTGYTECPKMTRLYPMYSSMLYRKL